MTLERGKTIIEGVIKVILMNMAIIFFNALPQGQLAMKVDDAVAMVNMARSEMESNDALANALTKTLGEAQMAASSIAPKTNNMNEIEQSFIQNVKEIVKASGIDLVLPLDCGRNPRHPESPLLSSSSGPFPWIAALGTRRDGVFHFLCVGLVITKSHVLTAAHCASSLLINVVRMNITSLPGNDNAVDYFVVGRRIHPSLETKDDFTNGANIGLLELAYPFTFNDEVQPICLPGIFEEIENEFKPINRTLVGFNNIKDVGGLRLGKVFVEKNVKVFPAVLCSDVIKGYNKRNPSLFSNLFERLTRNHICAVQDFFTNGRSVMVQEQKDSNGRSRLSLVGVGGIINSKVPVIIAYTRSQPHRFWIELVLKKYQDNVTEDREKKLRTFFFRR